MKGKKLPASIARLWCSVKNSDDNRFLNYFFLEKFEGEKFLLWSFLVF